MSNRPNSTVFISYHRSDRDYVERLAAHIEANYNRRKKGPRLLRPRLDAESHCCT
jgi:hypothetical protein